VDDLSHLLDDLSGSASPLDLDLPELEAPPRAKRERASDLLIDSAMAERVAEMLLAPPEAAAELPPPVARSRKARQPQTSEKPQVRTKDFNVLVVLDDAETCELVSKQLADYSVEIVHDGVSALAKLISFEPDLVVLDFDLPVVDGFKLLSLIRTSLDVPIIVVTGSRLRAIDRVMAFELGADYYLTKPLSAKELKYKARQLIARYRGIDSWIVSANTSSQSQPSSPVRREEFVPYAEFALEVEKRVKTAVDDVATFSVVGCSLPGMISDGGQLALLLFETARGLLRETDLISTNARNELVILLSDASASGARAFAARLRERIIRELDQAPSLWTRTFPHLEESNECASVFGAAFNDQLDRRITDRAPEAHII
jgi:DNA-binding response OmpR family regulator